VHSLLAIFSLSKIQNYCLCVCMCYCQFVVELTTCMPQLKIEDFILARNCQFNMTMLKNRFPQFP